MIYGYVRLEKNPASAEMQSRSVAAYAQSHGWVIDKMIQADKSISVPPPNSSLSCDFRSGDILIVDTFGRFGSLTFLQNLLETGVVVHSVQEDLCLGGDDKAQTIAWTLGLADSILKGRRSLLTKDNICLLRLKGQKVGRQVGAKAKHFKLDKFRYEIRRMLQDGASICRIAKELHVGYQTVTAYLERFPELKENG